MEINNLKLVHSDAIMQLEKEIAVLSWDNAYLKSEIDWKSLMLEQANSTNSVIEHKQDAIRKIYESHEKEVVSLGSKISKLQSEKQRSD